VSLILLYYLQVAEPRFRTSFNPLSNEVSKKWGVSPQGPVFYRACPYDPVFCLTILRREGTCAAVDAPDEVPTAMDAVLDVAAPRRTRSLAVTADATQCSLHASTSHRAWLLADA